jgi:hypothetical protein
MNLTIRIPDGVYDALKRYKNKEKPHMSLNARISCLTAAHHDILENLRFSILFELFLHSAAMPVPG